MTEAEVVKSTRKLFELSHETRILIIELRRLNVGDLMSYQRMEELTHTDIQHKQRSALDTARRRLWHDEAIFFGVVRGQGVERLTPGDAARSQEREVGYIHRASIRGGRRATAIDFDQIPSDEQASHVGRTTLFALFRDATSTKGRNRMLAAVRSENEQHKLDLSKALKALMP